jgi:hypothetical protein
MRIDDRVYVPVLKGKRGEFLALERLSEGTKAHLHPLIELPTLGSYDHDLCESTTGIDKAVEQFCRRLERKWTGWPCFVDTRMLPGDVRLPDGRHPLNEILRRARAAGCTAVPVVSPASDGHLLDAAAERSDNFGACLRLSYRAIEVPDLPGWIERLFGRLGLRHDSVDLVLDFGAIMPAPAWHLAQVVLGTLDRVPGDHAWRSITVAASAFPDRIQTGGTPMQRFRYDRTEWRMYEEIRRVSRATARQLTFGDYGPLHPEPMLVDGRLVDPAAKVRYATTASWIVLRGRRFKRHGNAQYRLLCRALAGSPFFDGPEFSAADQYILDCAEGRVSAGSLNTWVWVAVNRHLERVARDLATPGGLSAAA